MFENHFQKRNEFGCCAVKTRRIEGISLRDFVGLLKVVVDIFEFRVVLCCCALEDVLLYFVVVMLYLVVVMLYFIVVMLYLVVVMLYFVVVML